MATPGSVALVTGAGAGIGRACSLALAESGFSLVLAGRRSAPLEETAAAIRASGAEALAITVDVSDPQDVDRLFGAVNARFGRLDLLFNNAGVFATAAPLEDLSFADWKNSVDVNVTGTFLCTQHAVRMMKAQDPRGGRIINNGSISAHTPRPFSVAYTAAKHAVTGLTKATALEGRAYGIACGQIDIGNADTQMTTAMGHGVAQANGAVAVEPRMDVRHVADAVAYMAGLPLQANVLSMTVLATGMPFVGRG